MSILGEMGTGSVMMRALEADDDHGDDGGGGGDDDDGGGDERAR